MIRARTSTRDALREIAESENSTLIETLDRLVKRAHEERLLAAVEVSLGDHAHAMLAETEVLDDAVAADGLDPDDDFSDW